MANGSVTDVTNGKTLKVLINGGLVSITLITLVGVFYLITNHLDKNTEALFGVSRALDSMVEQSNQLEEAIESSTVQNARLGEVIDILVRTK